MDNMEHQHGKPKNAWVYRYLFNKKALNPKGGLSTYRPFLGTLDLWEHITREPIDGPFTTNIRTSANHVCPVTGVLLPRGLESDIN